MQRGRGAWEPAKVAQCVIKIFRMTKGIWRWTQDENCFDRDETHTHTEKVRVGIDWEKEVMHMDSPGQRCHRLGEWEAVEEDSSKACQDEHLASDLEMKIWPPPWSLRDTAWRIAHNLRRLLHVEHTIEIWQILEETLKTRSRDKQNSSLMNPSKPE